MTSETELGESFLGLPVEKHIGISLEKLAILSHSSEFIDTEKFAKKSTSKKPYDNLVHQLDEFDDSKNYLEFPWSEFLLKPITTLK